MAEEKVEKVEKVKTPAKKAVKVVLPKKCDHKGKLEAVSGEVPRAVERRMNVFQCKSCGAIVTKPKK